MYKDMHVHIALNSCFTKKQWNEAEDEKRILWLKEIFGEYKKRNITYLRDGGDSSFISYKARNIAKDMGIVYKSPVYGLYKRGYYGDFIGNPVSNLEEIKVELVKLLAYKPDHIKIVLTGIVNFSKYGDFGGTNFTPEELAYICDFARDIGIPVMVHANGSEGVSQAIKAGISTLEHGYLITEKEVGMMAEAGITWVPTLSPLGNILKSSNTKFSIDEKRIIEKVFDEQVSNLEKADKHGLDIALGSDAGSYLVGHGSGLIDEMKYFENISGFDRERIEKICKREGK